MRFLFEEWFFSFFFSFPISSRASRRDRGEKFRGEEERSLIFPVREFACAARLISIEIAESEGGEKTEEASAAPPVSRKLTRWYFRVLSAPSRLRMTSGRAGTRGDLLPRIYFARRPARSDFAVGSSFIGPSLGSPGIGITRGRFRDNRRRTAQKKPLTRNVTASMRETMRRDSVSRELQRRRRRRQRRRQRRWQRWRQRRRRWQLSAPRTASACVAQQKCFFLGSSMVYQRGEYCSGGIIKGRSQRKRGEGGKWPRLPRGSRRCQRISRFSWKGGMGGRHAKRRTGSKKNGKEERKKGGEGGGKEAVEQKEGRKREDGKEKTKRGREKTNCRLYVSAT